MANSQREQASNAIHMLQERVKMNHDSASVHRDQLSQQLAQYGKILGTLLLEIKDIKAAMKEPK
jgi:predicted transposase YbfD/YdcC